LCIQTVQQRTRGGLRGRLPNYRPGSVEAYKVETGAEAIGQTARFLKVYEEYKKAPEVTRKRMYLETMERVLGGTDKIILDSKGGQSVVPYLSLDQLHKP
jgi:membrane protease subunit HflK